MNYKSLFNPYQEQSCLPPSCQRAVRAVRQALRDESVFSQAVALPKALEMVANAFQKLPPNIAPHAMLEVRSIAGLSPIHLPYGSSARRASLQEIDQEVSKLEEAPELAMLYLFHADGRLRQAALHHLTPAMLSPFLFAALIMRLNDWARPVRQEAAASIARIRTSDSLSKIAPAIPYLCLQSKTWLRWDEFRAAYDRIEATPEVSAYMAAHLRQSRQGPLSRQFYTVLRNQSMDIHLPALVGSTATPAVRAAALSALLNGVTSWPVGQKRQWVDKSYGKYRLETLWGNRPIAPAENKTELALAGATDRAVTVRRVVASWLLRSGFPAPNVATILAKDTSASIRQIIDIYTRKQVENA